MKVKALVDIPSKNGTIGSGTIFNISEQSFTKLAGKVEIVTMTATEAAAKISTVLVKLDNQNPWLGKWRGILNEKGLELIRLANLKIDHAADILRDPEALDAALIEYKAAWSAVFEELLVDTPTTTPGESSASCRIDGDTCTIGYTPDLYQQHGHRNGKQVTVDGVPVKLLIEKITP